MTTHENKVDFIKLREWKGYIILLCLRLELQVSDLTSVCSCQARRHQAALNLVSFMWTWTVSLCPLGSDTNRSLKARHIFCVQVDRYAVCKTFIYMKRLGLADSFKNCLWIAGFPAGKPVAVTSNRGQGRAPIRAGANLQVELEHYQRKYPQPGEILSDHLVIETPTRLNKVQFTCLSEKADDGLSGTPSQDTPDSCGTGTDQEAAALSMAEIASCSYEAR